jgi:hypothetical protein
MILACSTSASVRVDLPASGWLMTANATPASDSARSTAPVNGDLGGVQHSPAIDRHRVAFAVSALASALALEPQ